MFRSIDPFAEDQPTFGFGAASPHASAGRALVGVNTRLGWARPRWTPSGSMWLDGEDFSLPLSRFDVRTLEPVFGPSRADAATMVGRQPISDGDPSVNEDRDRSPVHAGQRRLVAVDTPVGRATPRWNANGALSLEIDGVPPAAAPLQRRPDDPSSRSCE